MNGVNPSTQYKSAKRIVVKIGSALLADSDTGEIRGAWLTALTDDVAALARAGRQIILVSSGAIAVGRKPLKGDDRRPLKLEEKQAAAAIGQIRLAHAYQQALARHDLVVGQVLLGLHDTEQRRRYLNARNTMETLLAAGAVPLINENDTVATAEIRFGDNDRLAARVAQMTSADLLILLSDIDGLYSADPARDPTARRLDRVAALTPEILAMAGGSQSGTGSGGMITKLEAARIATRSGCHMVIGRGSDNHALAALMDGAPGTWFVAPESPLTARKRWIASGLNPAGTITVDDGAARALDQGRSLLPAGVTAIGGTFDRGDAVSVRDRENREIARGLCAYSAADAARIIGHKSREIEALLGYRGRAEMIHRDDLVLLSGANGETP